MGPGEMWVRVTAAVVRPVDRAVRARRFPVGDLGWWTPLAAVARIPHRKGG